MNSMKLEHFNNRFSTQSSYRAKKTLEKHPVKKQVPFSKEAKTKIFTPKQVKRFFFERKKLISRIK